MHPSLEANVTRLGIKIQDDDDDNCFYIALVSALEQTHCAFVGCDSEWATVAFYCAFWLSIQGSGHGPPRNVHTHEYTN